MYSHVDDAVRWGCFDLAHWATVRRPLEPLPGSLGHFEGDHMPEALSFTEIDRQHLELLPARAVMSMLVTGYGNASKGATGGDEASSTTTTTTTSSPTSSPTDSLKDPLALVFGLIPLKK